MNQGIRGLRGATSQPRCLTIEMLMNLDDYFNTFGDGCSRCTGNMKYTKNLIKQCKNAYPNYDDHCTVVVVIKYAFF